MFRYQLQAPKNRRPPKTKLNAHSHQLANILHKYHQRGSKQGHAKYQADTAKKVIKNLQVVDIRPVAIATKHYKEHYHKETMHQKSG